MPPPRASHLPPPLQTAEQKQPTRDPETQRATNSKSPTFHNELSEVGDARATAGLGDAAVEVLLPLGHLVQLEGGQEAPVADVLHGGGGDHLAALPLPRGERQDVTRRHGVTSRATKHVPK